MKIRRRKQVFLLATLLFLLFVSLLISLKTLATPTKNVTVTSDAYFVLENGQEINFANGQGFNSLNPDNATGEWYWVFDSYKFRSENANVIITQFFTDNRLVFDLHGTGTSTTKIYVADKGRPTSVDGASSWSYSSDTKILTVTVNHASPQLIDIAFMSPTGQAVIILVRQNYYLVLGLIGLIPIVAGASMIIRVVKGKESLSINEMYGFVSIVVTMVLAFIIIVNIMNALIGG